MYAIELFKELNSLDIVNELTKDPSFFELIDWDNTIDDIEKTRRKNKIKEAYIKEIDKIKEKIVFFDSSKILIVTRRLYDNDTALDISLLKANEIEKIKESISNPNDFKNPLYGINFTDRNEILGYKISEDSVKRYSKVLIASLILHDITSFGIEEELFNEKRDEIISSLDEISERIETGEEKTYSAEEVWESLGFVDSRSEEEKEMQKQESIRKAQLYIKCIIDDIKMTIAKEGL